MPYILTGNPENLASTFQASDIRYDYPDGLDLRPGSTLHNFLKNEILQRTRESNAELSKRFDSWRKMDRTLTAYIAPDEEEQDVKDKDSRKPVSIVFPYSFAIMETILTYLVMAFFQDPIFRYEGTKPEDTIGAILLEHIISLHCNKTKVPLALHTMFRDSLAYGIGAVAPDWYEKYASVVSAEEEVTKSFLGIPVGKRRVRSTSTGKVFEGNKLTNIDPYMMLPDPNVSIHDIQSGEYFGWIDRTNLMALLEQEKNGNGSIFNVKFLRLQHNKRGSQFYAHDSDREIRMGASTLNGSVTTNPVDVIKMYATIVPKDWKLGDSEYPEKWLFYLANDEVIIRAEPARFNHDMYPAAICAPDFDGYSIAPLSRLEILYGLQEVLDWLFNSHIANVRKAINDMLVVDPYLININDLKDPKPGKIIRMRRPAWGRGVNDAVKQLQVADITRANIADSAYIVEWMQKIGGADDPIMGSLRKGGPERLTGREFQGTQVGAASRLQRLALVISFQAMKDIGYMFASHTQQMMSQESYVRASGEWRDFLVSEYGGDMIKVSPYDLLIEYDVKIRDGTVPNSNFSEIWLRMFDIIAQQPELRNEFDIVKIFKHIARNAGEKNVDDFTRVKVQAQPDEQVIEEAQRGNLIPIEGGRGVGVQ